MASVTAPNRDKKLIIWNFMEELWEKHQNAIENKLDTEFKIMDLYNVGLIMEMEMTPSNWGRIDRSRKGSHSAKRNPL